MASGPVSKEHPFCPVCCEISVDPVLLGCSHRVCRSCLQVIWNKKGSRNCPVCKRRSSMDFPLQFSSESLTETLCSLHSQELRLFCLDDQQPVCLDCCDSETHTNHSFCSLRKAARENKTNLSADLKSLKEKEKTFKECKLNLDQAAEHLQTQAQDTERQIKEEFEKLHQFLQDEEAARIAALREEERQKSQRMQEKIEKISGELEVLSDTIRAVEEEMEDVSFVQNYKPTVERAQHVLQDPESLSVELLHVENHLTNLKFTVWQNMKEIVQFCPVTLNPNTAHPNLILSDELTTVRFCSERQEIPDNPERFDYQRFVLGSVGFNSGTHCWDVEVGDGRFWGLGVIAESASRKGNVDSRSGMWGIMLYNGIYAAGASPNAAPIPVQVKPQRITVRLNWNKGKLYFYDSPTNKLLHTVKHKFTQKVFPWFYVDDTESYLKVLAERYK